MLQIRTKADAEKHLGIQLSYAEWSRYAEAAILKIGRIIEREGDADGLRQQDWYFWDVLSEIISQDRLSKSLFDAQKDRAAATARSR